MKQAEGGVWQNVYRIFYISTLIYDDSIHGDHPVALGRQSFGIFSNLYELCVWGAGTMIYRSEYLMKLASKAKAGIHTGPESAALAQYLGSLPSFKEAPLSLK